MTQPVSRTDKNVSLVNKIYIIEVSSIKSGALVAGVRSSGWSEYSARTEESRVQIPPGNLVDLKQGWNMVGFNISTLTLALLIFTSIMSAQAHRFQVQTSIRESVEQLDDIFITNATKMKPIISGFKYLSRWDIYNSETEVLVKFYSSRQDLSSVSSPHHEPFFWLNETQKEVLRQALENFETVESVRFTDGGLIFKAKSREAVDIRRATQTVMESIRYSYIHRK